MAGKGELRAMSEKNDTANLVAKDPRGSLWEQVHQPEPAAPS